MGKHRLKFGIIGCGSVVRDLHMPAWAQIDGVSPVAVCDVNENLLKKFASDYGIADIYTSIEEFLLAQSQNLDFICVATPAFTHYEIARKVLNAGNHLLIEKPIAQSLNETEELKRLSKSRLLSVCVIQNYRFREHITVVLDKLDRGTMGTLETIYCRFRTGGPKGPPTHWTHAERRHKLLLYDYAIHFIDLVVCFGGPIKKIKGIDYISDGNNTKYIAVVAEHQNGVRSVIELQTQSPFQEASIQLRGDKCVADIQFYPEGCSFNKGMQNPFVAFRNEGKRLFDLVTGIGKEKLGLTGKRRARSHYSLFKSFVQSLREPEKPLPVSIDAVLPTIRFLDEISHVIYY